MNCVCSLSMTNTHTHPHENNTRGQDAYKSSRAKEKTSIVQNFLKEGSKQGRPDNVVGQNKKSFRRQASNGGNLSFNIKEDKHLKARQASWREKHLSSWLDNDQFQRSV